MDGLIDQKENNDSNNFSYLAKVKHEPELTIIDNMRLKLVININIDIVHESKIYILLRSTV